MTTVLDVTDNETPTLTVDVLAAAVAENAGAAATTVTITRNTPTDSDLLVTLAPGTSALALGGLLLGILGTWLWAWQGKKALEQRMAQLEAARQQLMQQNQAARRQIEQLIGLPLKAIDELFRDGVERAG